MDTIYKAYGVEVKTVDAEQGIYDLLASAETKDRDGDILVADGADLSAYRKNPVVLWAHDYKALPVGKAIDIQSVSGKGLKARVQFAPMGIDPHIDAVRQLWAGGFLNAASVGFIPTQSEPHADKAAGFRFTKWQLLEFSIVPVPANADALRLSMKAMDDALVIEKKGRVLSGANEAKLRAAAQAISEVLSQLDSGTDATAEASSDAPVTKDADAEIADWFLAATRDTFRSTQNG